MQRYSGMMQKKTAILTTLVLTVLWIGLSQHAVHKQPDAAEKMNATFCATSADEHRPSNYGGLIALMSDFPCEYHQMQNTTSICTSRTSSLRNQRKTFRLQCVQFARISHDLFQTAYMATETMKAIGHHSHRVLLTSCCMRC